MSGVTPTISAARSPRPVDQQTPERSRDSALRSIENIKGNNAANDEVEEVLRLNRMSPIAKEVLYSLSPPKRLASTELRSETIQTQSKNVAADNAAKNHHNIGRIDALSTIRETVSVETKRGSEIGQSSRTLPSDKSADSQTQLNTSIKATQSETDRTSTAQLNTVAIQTADEHDDLRDSALNIIMTTLANIVEQIELISKV